MMRFTPVMEIFTSREIGEFVRVRGWLYRTRSSGSIVFLTIRDSSGVVQTTAVRGECKNFNDAKKALVESSLIVEGEIVADNRAPGGREIRASKVEIVHFAEPFPITKDKSDEFLLDNRHLWLRSREMTARLKIRSTVFDEIRTFFHSRGYYEVQSPSFVSSACEGGSTLFEVKYFDRKVYLSQSWQLYAEAMIFGLERIFTIAPSFRAEKSRTRRHLTEFWHAEVECAWVHNDDMMELAEDLITHLAHRVAFRNRAELEYLKRDPGCLLGIDPPFERMKYEEALDELASRGIALEWGADFGYIEEKALTEDRSNPLFITHYPREKGFYHLPDPEEPRVLRCHDLLAPEGYGEIIGGGERIWNRDQLIERIKECGLDVDDYEWYIDLRRYGSIPHSGFGLGIDRCVAWLTGADHIKNVIPFPRTIRRVRP